MVQVPEGPFCPDLTGVRHNPQTTLFSLWHRTDCDNGSWGTTGLPPDLPTNLRPNFALTVQNVVLCTDLLWFQGW